MGRRDQIAPGLTAVKAAAPAVIASAGVVGTAATNGGYFPTDFGRATLGFLLVAAAALLVLDHYSFGRLDYALLGGLLAFTGWVGLSAVWSTSLAQPLLELERSLGYVAAVFGLLLVASPRSAPSLLGGLLAGITAVCTYALATRLFPGEIAAYDPSQGYQLAEPLGYWNALGMLAGLGILLALGVAAHAEAMVWRALGAGAIGLLAPTLYFTFSRGAWIALGLGILALLVLDARRLRLSVTLLVLAPAPALAVWLCSRAEALTTSGSTLRDASEEGHLLAAAIVALTLVSAALVVALAWVDRRFAPGRRVRLAYVAALAVLVSIGLAGVVARVGSPAALVQDAYDDFRAPLPATGSDLNRRLLSFSGNGRADYWRVAWDQVEANPWVGAGAGSYERYWVERRPTAFYARDAHNLYLETLAELGPIGVVLLLCALAVPLVAYLRIRKRPLSAIAAGAYVAFLTHAGIDWDWEIPSLALAGLFCGVALVAAARPEAVGRQPSIPLRSGVLAPVLAAIAFVFVMQVANSATLDSSEALAAGDISAAEDEARKATHWSPWSHEPWQRLGEAEFARGDGAAARQSFRKAIERDPYNWSLWYDLAVASRGEERRHALNQLSRLNPLDPAVRELLAKR